MKKIYIYNTIFIFFSIVMLPVVSTAAISGVVSYSYSTTVVKDSTKSHSFNQSYGANNSGFFLNRNIGSYSLGFSYTNSKSRSSSLGSEEGERNIHTKNSSDNYTYSASSSLFPRTFSPITFSFSRITTEIDENANPLTRGTAPLSKTESDSFKLTWRLISQRKLPTLNSSFSLINSKSASTFTKLNESTSFLNKRNERKRNVKLDLNKSGLRTMYRINYNFEDFLNREVALKDQPYRKSHAVNFNVNKLLSRRVTFNGGGGFNKTAGSENFNLSANLFVRHNSKQDSNFTYNFTRASSTPVSYTNRISAVTRYNPTSKLRTNFSYNFTNSVPNPTNTHNVSAGGSYNLTERWNTNASSSLTYVDSSSRNSFSHNYSAGTNYSKPFRHIRLSSGYTFSFSGTISDRQTEGVATFTSNSDNTQSQQISISPSNLSFGKVAVGSSSDPQTFTISNKATSPGNVTLKISGLTLSDSSNFSIDKSGGDAPCGTLPKDIAAGGKCTITITFSPQSNGIITGNLTVDSDDPSSPSAVITFSGGEEKKTSSKIKSTNSTHSAYLNFTSRTLKKIGLTLNNNLSRTSSKSDGVSTGTENISSSLGMNISVIKGLSLTNSISYINSLATERSQLLTLSTNFTFTLPYVKNVVISSGYSFTTNLSGKQTEQSSNSYNVSTSFSKRVTRNLRFSISLRRTRNSVPGGATSSINAISPSINYQIGKLTFSVESALQDIKTKNSDAKTYNLNYNFILKASRRF